MDAVWFVVLTRATSDEEMRLNADHEKSIVEFRDNPDDDGELDGFSLQLRLQPRIPSRPIRTLQRPFPTIPKQRTELEPLLATADAVDTPLVSQIHILPNRQTLSILVAQDDSSRSLGFAHDVTCPRASRKQ